MVSRFYTFIYHRIEELSYGEAMVNEGWPRGPRARCFAEYQPLATVDLQFPVFYYKIKKLEVLGWPARPPG